jgi:uncharacterized protein YeaO (DUF488 family)/nucleotide-binding universal stress UspA family protein
MTVDEIGRRAHPQDSEPRVAVRRAYAEPTEQDGTRVLVDRIWPRGLRKSEAGLDEWCKEVAPSTALRKWYGHDPLKFEEFRRRYRAELTQPERSKAVRHLRELADVRRLTLVTGTKDPDISQAAVLADLLCRRPISSPQDRSFRTADAEQLPDIARRISGDGADTAAAPAPVPAPGSDVRDDAPHRGSIVVGVDGSAGAQAALEWAVHEAALRDRSVRAVMAWHYSPAYGDAWIWPTEGLEPAAICEQVLDSVVAELPETEDSTGVVPTVEITSSVVEGHAGHALLLAAEEADLLVVGSRGRGGLVGALLGSVSQHVVAHARCPVVVVPDPERRSSGLDGGRLAT